MKRQITQFDNDRANATVATPTCSSCCCCCCCLTTTLASSTILARRVNKEAREKRIKDPIGLTALAAAFLPVIGALSYLLIYTINSRFSKCIEAFIPGSSESYQYCTSPGHNPFVIVPVVLLVSFTVLWYLYMRVKMRRPVLRAAIVTTVVAVCFVGEGFGGAVLILTGVGGVGYLLSVPILYAAVQRFYSRVILHETIFGNKINEWQRP